MRVLLQPLGKEAAMWFQNAFAVTAHLAGSNRSGRAMALRPLHHRRNGHLETRSHCTTTLAVQNGCYNTFTKIIRQRCGREMLASIQSASMNHNKVDSGIRPDSEKCGNSSGRLNRLAGLIFGHRQFRCRHRWTRVVTITVAIEYRGGGEARGPESLRFVIHVEAS